MNRSDFYTIEQRLKDDEVQFDAHNQDKVCNCAFCEMYRILSRNYQVESCKREGAE